MRYLTILILIFLQSGLIAQHNVPDETMERLQDIMSIVRDKMWDRVDEFWHDGDYNRCIVGLRLIAEMAPMDPQAYDTGAWLMESEMRDYDAEAFLMRGVNANPDNYEMQYNIGFFYYMHERFDEAITHLEKATTFLNIPQFTWHTLAHAYELAGYKTDALDIWFQMEILEPDNNVPGFQIERMISNGPPSATPAFRNKARRERLQFELHPK